MTLASDKKELVADEMVNDVKVMAAKTQLMKELDKHRRKIDKICPPIVNQKVTYTEMLAHFSEIRGINLWYPYIGSGMGNGALVELADGSVKYDFISGIGVHFGHCHPKLVEAQFDAAYQNTVMQGFLQQNRDTVALTELLTQESGLPHCILSTTGAAANENALKLCFQKQAPAQRILAFERCFMGRSLALANITDKPAFRQGLPHLLHVDYIPFYDWKNPLKSTRRSLQVLERHLKRYPKHYALMAFELIQGEGGYYPGTTEFFTALMKLLKEHDVAILVDEVQTFGRTDRLFAFQHFGLQPFVDIVTIGKLAQTCATLYTNAYKPKPGLISSTFTSSTAAIRASHTIIESLLNDGYLGSNGRNLQIRKRFVSHLEKMSERHPQLIEGPYGLGMMIACTPLGGNREKVIQLLHNLFEAGVMTFVASENPTRIRFLLPAGGVKDDDIDAVAKILEEELVKLA